MFDRFGVFAVDAEDLSRSGSEIIFCFPHCDALSFAYVRMNEACYMSVSDVFGISRINRFARTRTSIGFIWH
jgi:hypothetical protein